MNKEERISHELHIIDSLLQDEQYAADMAAELDAAYYRGTGQKCRHFLRQGKIR